MDKKNCYCVIMAGGPGTRIWPVSRSQKPKQFLDLTKAGRSCIQQTFDRFSDIVPKENIVIVTTEKYKDLVQEHLPNVSSENILVEPYGRNTAPCIVLATYTILKRNPDARIVITPADHIIDNRSLFAETVTKALEYIDTQDVIMTLGVVPDRPDCNYGYIQAYGGNGVHYNHEPMQVKTFTEKPNKEIARIFLSTGEFFWNTGVLVTKASVMRKETEKHIPQVTKLFNGWEVALGSKVESEFIARAYSDCMNISIDGGVMEKTTKAWIYPVRFDWVDIGTWEALYNYCKEKDYQDNIFYAEKSISEDNKGTIVLNKGKQKLVAVKGLEDYIVVDTEDVLIICPKDDKTFKDFISELAMPEYEKYR